MRPPGLPISGEFRAGGWVLSLFAAPLNALILEALAEKPRRMDDLGKRLGGLPLTTVRAHVGLLAEVGAVSKEMLRAMPYAVAWRLTPCGRELLFVVEALAAWLSRCPDGPIYLGSERAKTAVNGLTGSWSAAIVRALVIEPHTLTELTAVLKDIPRHTLERRLATMRAAGQVRTQNVKGKRGTVYALTAWLRQGIGPLAAAGRWERRYLPEQTDPVTRVEVEASFLATLALVKLPGDLSGECVLAVEVEEEERYLSGVRITVEAGRIVSIGADLRRQAAGLAMGSVQAWMDAVIEDTVEPLHIEGDRELVVALVGALHRALFGGG